jgi:hypothetical protein
MTNTDRTSLPPGAAIPPDNPHSRLAVASQNDPNVHHISRRQRLYDPSERRRH